MRKFTDITLRVLCLSYLVALSLLLLSEEPLRFFGVDSPLRDLAPRAHFPSFLVLTILALAARWTMPQWAVISCLVTYAGATEFLQAFVPGRSPSIVDGLHNLAGIAVGCTVCWIVVGVGILVSRGFNRRGVVLVNGENTSQ
ncbi:MAG: VanZ family protein [Candidatus Nealsonbacteria bacterium]|nr:VanZ family protein [Candidatus Nealsonbacteria bacterium]